jgi:hypothetical protein
VLMNAARLTCRKPDHSVASRDLALRGNFR